MFLNQVPQANSEEDMELLKNSIYTKWTLKNSFLRGSTAERGSLQVPYTPGEGEDPIDLVSYKMSIRNYTISVLNFGIQVSVDKEETWQWLGNGMMRDRFYNDRGNSYYYYAIAGHQSYSNSVLSSAVITNPKYYGTFFVINQIVEEASTTYPYGYVLVTPYFSAFNDTTHATNYAGGNSIEHCVAVEHNAGLQWWFSCGALWGGSNTANSSLQFTIPFGTEDEKNYALGISEKFKRITAQEYEEMTGIVVPTAADINRHYEELQENNGNDSNENSN